MQSQHLSNDRVDRLAPIQNWLACQEIENLHLARAICWLIPGQCPFARKISFGDRVLFEIPPLCKINPFYDRLMELRFKSLVYLEWAANRGDRIL